LPTGAVDRILRLLTVGVQNAQASLAQAPAIGLKTSKHAPGIGCGRAAQAHHVGPARRIFSRASALLG
jgi:hypothetical protein